MNEAWMRVAIEEADRNMASGAGGPFGACIVRENRVLASAGNRVLANHDPTAHAEVLAIRAACAAAGAHLLEDAEIYSTTEPCPMCFAAIHWARIRRVVYGTAIADVQRLGFNELTLSNEEMRRLGGSPVEIVPGFLADACRDLLARWTELPDEKIY